MASPIITRATALHCEHAWRIASNYRGLFPGRLVLIESPAEPGALFIVTV